MSDVGTRDEVARADTVEGTAGAPAVEDVGLPPPLVFRRELSRGGMGRVLIAWDEQHGREVAVKVIGAADEALVLRFAREAQVTARLQHPAIVPVYQSGTLAGGDPFYVMRLVSGHTLDAVLANRKLPARLALLPRVLAAAEAVAYAHDRHVVHRDLKPQNILVGQFGDTVVIDWGLAKDLVAVVDEPVSGEVKPSGGPVTVAGQVMGTPAYMPPEQARGEEVDERADVYALGAVLYHVLQGAPPYEGSSAAEVIAAVLEAPPPPLAREVPPDLRAIVDKAMARDARQRYPSAAELSEDLRKYTTGQLVGAHDYSLLDLVRRFAARQIAAVVVGAVLVLAIVALTAVGMRRIARERDVAEARRAEAQQARESAEGLVRYLVVELAERLERLGWIDALKGVGEAVVRYEESRPGGAPSPRLARALELVAQSEGPRGDLATAERALRASLEIRRRAVAAAPGDLVARRDLLGTEAQLMSRLRQRSGATSEVLAFAAREPSFINDAESSRDPAQLDTLAKALIEVARIHELESNLRAEISTLRSAVRTAERAVELQPRNAAYRQRLVDALVESGDALRRDARHVEAAAALDKAVALEEALTAEHPGEAKLTFDLWHALQQSAIAASDHGDYARANALGARTLSMIVDLTRRHPENVDYHEAHVFTLDLLGAEAFDQGRYPAARALFTELVQATDKLRAQGVDLHDVESRRGHALQLLGWIDVLGGHPEAAITSMREALAIEERSVATRPGDTSAELDLCEQLSDLGYAELHARRFADAAGHLQRAAALADRNLSREPGNLAWQLRAAYAFGWLGAAQGGDGKDAKPALVRAVAVAAPLATKTEDPDSLSAAAEASAMALETLGAQAPPEAQPLLAGVLPLLQSYAKRGELYASAASELPKWKKLATPRR